MSRPYPTSDIEDLRRYLVEARAEVARLAAENAALRRVVEAARGVHLFGGYTKTGRASEIALSAKSRNTIRRG